MRNFRSSNPKGRLKIMRGRIKGRSYKRVMIMKNIIIMMKGNIWE
jgi:hypothetical protein